MFIAFLLGVFVKDVNLIIAYFLEKVNAFKRKTDGCSQCAIILLLGVNFRFGIDAFLIGIYCSDLVIGADQIAQMLDHLLLIVATRAQHHGISNV